MQAPGRICNKIVIFAEEASVHETIRAAEQAEQEKPESAPRRPPGHLVRPLTRDPRDTRPEEVRPEPDEAGGEERCMC